MQLYLLVPLLYPAPFKNRTFNVARLEPSKVKVKVKFRLERVGTTDVHTCMYICITRRLKGQLAVAIEVRDADLVTNEGDFMIERELKG